MTIIKRFLQSNLYILLVTLLAFIAFISTGEYQVFNTIAMIVLLVMFASVLAFFRDTSPVLPIAFGLIYSYNTTNPNLNTISEFNLIYLIVIFVIGGLVTHIIRFRPKPKKGILYWSYILFAVAYFVPMIYRPFTWTLFQLSFISIVYLLIYVLLGSTLKPTKSYMMKILFAASVLLVMEMLFKIGTGYLDMSTELPILERIKEGMRTSWHNGDFGWGNINDVAIHITLLMGAQIYYIISFKKRTYYWFIPLVTVVVILLSASRGGYISMALSIIFYGILIFKDANKWTWINFVITALLAVILGVLMMPILVEAYDLAIQGGFNDLDQFSSSRITLYKHALSLFKDYPLFGAGWEAMIDIGNPDRIQVFHSTVFHTLAVMGLFGMFALIYYFYVSFKFLFTNKNLPKTLLGIGILISQIHGLYDNTQFMLIYTIASIFIFTLLESFIPDDI